MHSSWSLQRKLAWWSAVAWVPLVAWALGRSELARWSEGLAAPWVGVMFALGALGVIWWSSRSVTLPMQRAANVLRALHCGDYSVRAGKAGAVASIGLVLDELNLLAERLHEQRQRGNEGDALLRKLVAIADLGIWAVDEQQRIELCNREAAMLLGAEGAVVGRNLSEFGALGLLAGADDAVVNDPLSRARGRYRLRRQPFRQSGKGRTLICLSRVEESLQREEKETAQRVIRVLGHEVNNTLAPIGSLVQTLQARVQTASIDASLRTTLGQAFEIIGRRADALGRFMDAYSRLSRVPAPRPRELDLQGWLCDCVGLEQRMSVALTIGDAAKVSVVIDPDLLGQALINLISNGVEAVLQAQAEDQVFAAPPRVEVRAQLEGGILEIAVVDQGVGIASVDNLFTPLFTTKAQGSGIGLALAREVLQIQGGSVELHPRSDGLRGARAVIRLPGVRAE